MRGIVQVTGTTVVWQGFSRVGCWMCQFGNRLLLIGWADRLAREARGAFQALLGASGGHPKRKGTVEVPLFDVQNCP